MKLEDPLSTVEVAKEYDVKVNVNGGGFKGQAEAIRMAIARALVKIDEDYRSPLKAKKFLTRDARVVERKKYGKPKAHILHEHLAIAEAKKLGLTTFAMVDTNSDPNQVDFPIPANDDASKSISMITNFAVNAIKEGLSDREKNKEELAGSTAK
ncbi:UNVERIFIED_CONTAM: hypothetical protein GTU68_057313 [Idotea baltica]|nr:hypothetical protein [Idotea baltica]